MEPIRLAPSYFHGLRISNHNRPLSAFFFCELFMACSLVTDHRTWGHFSSVLQFPCHRAEERDDWRRFAVWKYPPTCPLTRPSAAVTKHRLPYSPSPVRRPAHQRLTPFHPPIHPVKQLLSLRGALHATVGAVSTARVGLQRRPRLAVPGRACPPVPLPPAVDPSVPWPRATRRPFRAAHRFALAAAAATAAAAMRSSDI